MAGNNPETQARYYKRWREENRDKYLTGKREHYLRNRERGLHERWVHRLRAQFGITEEQYDEMYLRQGGVCAICRKPETLKRQGTPRRLGVDHCHQTGQVRGLLCHHCNAALGHFRDDPSLLRRAAAYLAEYLPL